MVSTNGMEIPQPRAELNRDRPMEAVHKKTGVIGPVKKINETKMLAVGHGFDQWTAYFDRYGQPKDDFCPWVVRNVPSAFEGIKAGLEDALAYAQGDTSRGKVVRGVDWSKPIEAVHDGGTVQAAELLPPREGFTQFREVKYGELYDQTRWFAEDGSGGDSGWRIRNVQSYTDAVMELGRDHKVGYDPIPNSVELKWSEPENDTIPVDKTLWELVVGLVREISGPTGGSMLPGNWQREARAIVGLLPAPPVDEAEELMKEFYLSDKYDPKAPRHADTVKAAIAFTLARGRALERGE